MLGFSYFLDGELYKIDRVNIVYIIFAPRCKLYHHLLRFVSSKKYLVYNLLPSMMRLEKIVPEDKEEIRAMSAGIWEGNDYIPKVFDRWVEDEGFYKGVLDDRIIAVCKYTRHPGGVLWLEGLRVHPKLQNKGYGSEVAGMFHRLITSKEYTALRFMTDATNAKSIHLAEKRGFDVVLELYHLDYEGVGDEEEGIAQEYDLGAVKDFVFSSREYQTYRKMYIKNWTAYDLTPELLEEELKAGNCFSVKENDEIQGVIFMNYHRRYGRVSVPFLAGADPVVDKLIRHAMWWSGEYGKGYLLLKTPFQKVKEMAETAGMELAPYRKVLVLELKNK